jgi:hypothetical protein
MKAPAFQFYPGDWFKDVPLQMASLHTKGFWFEMLLHMWDAPERGKLEGTKEQICRLMMCQDGDFDKAMEEIVDLKIADVTLADKKMTIINRRMFREQKFRINHKDRQVRYINKKKLISNDGKNDSQMTPPSSSSSSSSNNKTLAETDFLATLKAKFTWLNFDQEMIKIDAWLLAHPGRKKTHRFIVNWLNKIEKPMEIVSQDPYANFERA